MPAAELASYFTGKAPFQFPVNFREWFVKYWPIITLVVMLLAIPAILVFLGLGTVPVSFPGYVSIGLSHTLTIILSIIGLCPGMLALPGLFNRKRAG